MQLRVFGFLDFKYLVKILDFLDKSNIRTVHLILNAKVLPSVILLEDLVHNYKKIGRVLLFNAKSISKEELTLPDRIHVIDTEKIGHESCGYIGSDIFSLNIETISESQNYNTCLNRKLSVDINGSIKNCPSILESFGNINDVSPEELVDVVKSKLFQKYWRIKKDDIKICRDCEFRHICTDCRVYREDEEDIYSKPLKCGYNPYIAKWNYEEGYQSVADSVSEGIVSEKFIYRSISN